MRSLLAAVGFAALAPAALAQEADGPLSRVYACAGIAASAERLACFDAAIAGLQKQESEGEVAVVSREQVEKAETAAFGLASPRVADVAPKLAARAGAEDTGVQTLKVTSIYKAGDGRFRFVMENGQLWRQTDNVRLVSLGDGPWEAEIRKGMLGTFFLKVDGKTAVRAKRDK